MLTPDPTFPPLLTGHPVPASADVFETACAEARAGRFSAGDLVWSRRTDVVALSAICNGGGGASAIVIRAN